jgi:BirA family biotin operon repressor/biotin-[acetyl-CoA-carboxylase] ligase
MSIAELRERWGREGVVAYGKIDSTNSAARDLAEGGADAGTIVLCREQTSGRGRQERQWHSPPDTGLYLTLILRPGEAALSPLVSVLAGLGVVLGLRRGFPGLGASVKWPNDLMVDDRKLGGVLAEASSTAAGPRFLLVGVGVNVRSMAGTMSARLRRQSTWIDEHCPDVDLPAVADAVIGGLERWLHDPPSALDAATLATLDEHDWLKNRRVRANLSPEDPALPGVATGIAPDGALLFRPDRGALRRITTASIEVDREEAG